MNASIDRPGRLQPPARGWNLRSVVALCLWALAGCAGQTARAAPAPPTPPAGPRPNVLIILTDDQGYGDLSCHGNPVLKTPHLDRLAGQSIRLTDFHAAPICTPTRSQLLTGLDAMHNGAFAWAYTRHLIRPDVPTLAEIFAANGYATAHFGKWHLGEHYPHRPHDRGFQETIYHGGAGITQSPDYWNNDYFNDHFRHNGRLEQFPGYCTDVWFTQAMAFMKRCREQRRPFLVYLATNAPHAPLYLPERYHRLYRDHPNLPATYFGSVPRFFGMIANIDDNMGRLERFLVENGLRDNTLLIWMTDNGGTAGVRVFNAGMRGHKGHLYDGGHRVPCFIRWPAGQLRPPGELDALTVVQDILPTLVDLCRLNIGEQVHFDGVSLAPLLRGQRQNLDDRMVVIQHATAPQATEGHAVVLWKKWRYIVHRGQLYDMATDPAQTTDIAADHPQVVQKMLNHYRQWWKSTEPTRRWVPRLVVGDEHENPVVLCCFDWYHWQGRGNLTIQPSIRQGIAVTGSWNIQVARAGRYRIALHRWPPEAQAPIAAAVPSYRAVDAVYPAGKALPITSARLAVAGLDLRRAVAPSDTAAVFEVALPAGPATLQTWFMDRDGRTLCSAYYVSVRRL